MAHVIVLNALGSGVYLKAAGAGSSGDPHIPAHTLDEIVAALPAGTNNIGDVDILTLVGDNIDLDSGAGTDTHAGVAVLLPASGGHVIGGTPTNPIRVDTVGSTVQRIAVASWFPGAGVVASIAGVPNVVASVIGVPAVVGSMHVGNFPSVQAVSIASAYVPQNVVASAIGTIFAVVNTGAVGTQNAVVNTQATVNIGATIHAVVNTGAVGTQHSVVNTQATVNVAGIVTVHLYNPEVQVQTGSIHVGNFPAVQPISLASVYVGMQVVASAVGTIFAVVNTGAVGTQNSVVGGSVNVVGNIVASTIGTIFAVVNTSAAGTGHMVVNTQATVNVAGGVLVASVIGAPSVLASLPQVSRMAVASWFPGAGVVASVIGAPSVVASIPNIPTVAIASAYWPWSMTGSVHVGNYPGPAPANIVSGIGRTAGVTTGVSVLAAAGASLRNFITAISVVNAAVSAGTPFNVYDGTATLFTGYAAEKGGGLAQAFTVPIKAAVGGTIVIAATVASSDLYATLVAYKGQVGD